MPIKIHPKIDVSAAKTDEPKANASHIFIPSLKSKIKRHQLPYLFFIP